VEVFLYFYEAKRLGLQLWVFFNGVSGRALLTLFQSSYKNFKGKFLKFRCNKRNPTLLVRFPLYWTEKPRFQGARCLKDLPPSDEEVCRFLTGLTVVFDIAFLLGKEFSPKVLKAYTGTSHFLPLMRQTFISMLTICLLFFAKRMLAKIDRKELAERAKRMRATAHTLEDLKLKAPIIVVQTLTEDQNKIQKIRKKKLENQNKKL